MERDPWSPGRSELVPREKRRRELVQELGLPLPEWEDETTAPPINHAEIADLFDGKLEPNRTSEITVLIFRFRSWAEAYCREGLTRRTNPV